MESLKPEEGQVSPEAAVKASNGFLKKAGIDIPDDPPFVIRATMGRPDVGLYHINYGFGYDVCVDVASGKVKLFTNHVQQIAYIRGAAGRGRPMYDNAIFAPVYARALATCLGVPGSYKLVEFYFAGGGVDRRGRAYVTEALASFGPEPYGYRIENYRGDASLRFDVNDGTLMTYAWFEHKPLAVESHIAKLSYDQAVAIAKPVAEKYSVGIWRRSHRSEDPQLLVVVPSHLAFVQPNSAYGCAQYATRPSYLRLAWVLCYPMREQIWVDAADGELLGGSYLGPHMEELL